MYAYKQLINPTGFFYSSYGYSLATLITQAVQIQKQRKMSYGGYILSRSGDCLEKKVIQGTTPGSRTRGRQTTAWIKNITSWTDLPLHQLLKKNKG